MEKLEAGQVWANSKGNRRRITAVLSYRDEVHFVNENDRTSNRSRDTFHAWINNTGAKLEGRDG